jgi:hypothetical protein
MMGRKNIPLIMSNRNMKECIGAEIGVGCGIFSEFLLNSKIFKKLYSIDAWNDSIQDYSYLDGRPLIKDKHNEYLDSIKRLSPFKNKSEIIIKTSEEANILFEDESLDFVFIDANHTYDYVKQDLNLWYPKVKKGGIFSGHDYINTNYIYENREIYYFEVKKAVDEFIKEKNLKLLILEEPDWYPSWLIFK